MCFRVWSRKCEFKELLLANQQVASVPCYVLQSANVREYLRLNCWMFLCVFYLSICLFFQDGDAGAGRQAAGHRQHPGGELLHGGSCSDPAAVWGARQAEDPERRRQLRYEIWRRMFVSLCHDRRDFIEKEDLRAGFLEEEQKQTWRPKRCLFHLHQCRFSSWDCKFTLNLKEKLNHQCVVYCARPLGATNINKASYRWPLERHPASQGPPLKTF